MAARAFEIGAVERSFAFHAVEFIDDITRAGLTIEVAPGIFEVSFQEIGVVGLEQDVETHFAAVEFDHRVGGAWGGHAGVAEHLVAEPLGQVSRILDGVVEMELLEPMKKVARLKFVEIEGEAGLVIDLAEAAGRAFEMDADVFVDLVALADFAHDVLMGFAPELADVGLRNLELDVEKFPAGEESVGQRLVLFGVAFGQQGAGVRGGQQDGERQQAGRPIGAG